MSENSESLVTRHSPETDVQPPERFTGRPVVGVATNEQQSDIVVVAVPVLDDQVLWEMNHFTHAPDTAMKHPEPPSEISSSRERHRHVARRQHRVWRDHESRSVGDLCWGPANRFHSGDGRSKTADECDHV